MTGLDALDATILRDLTWRPLDPQQRARGPKGPWDTARALGVHGTTVKRRILEMRASGLLAGVYLQPAGALVDRHLSVHWLGYEGARGKRRALEDLVATPEAWEIHAFVGGEICLVLATDPGEDADRIAGRIASETRAVWRTFHHDSGREIALSRVTSLDLRILAAYTGDALRPVKDVASEVGVTPKTVTQRLRVLTSLGAYSTMPIVRSSATSAAMLCVLDLELSGEDDTRVHAALANRFPFAIGRSAPRPGRAYIVLPAGHASAIDEALSLAETTPGVKSSRALLHQETVLRPDRYRDALLARAETLALSRGSASALRRARAIEGIPA